MIDKTKSILVLGAYGRLGKQVINKLEESGYTNILFPTHNMCDLLNPYSYEQYFHSVKPSYVINLAAKITNINLCNHYPASIARETVLMSTAALEMCKRYEVEKLVNVISSCAYDGEASLLKEEEFLTGSPHPSIMAHGLAKRMVYFLGNSYAKQYHMNVVNVAFNTFFGHADWSRPNSLKFLDSLIVKIVDAKLLKYKNVEIWGSGKPRREVIYTPDAAEGLLRTFETYNKEELINVGCGVDYTIADYANMIAQIVRYKGELCYDKNRPDGQYQKLFSVEKQRSELDWSPPTNIKDAISATIEDYKEFSKNRERTSYRLT